jgi:hypothetical protein
VSDCATSVAGPVGLEAKEPSGLAFEDPRGLLGHRNEDLDRRGLASDERCHPPQRGLFRREHTLPSG